jgi:hypothetical protein
MFYEPASEHGPYIETPVLLVIGKKSKTKFLVVGVDKFSFRDDDRATITDCIRATRAQGCQMVCFQTKNHEFG